MEMADILFKKGSTVITAPPDTTVLSAAKIMTKNKNDLLLICSQPGRLIGWISERDIVGIIAESTTDLSQLTVENQIHKEYTICSSTDDPRDVLNTLHDLGYRYVPVIEYGMLKGLVSSREILKFLVEESDAGEDSMAWAASDFL